MIEFIAAALAGSAHVLAGPDHLAAVAPLASSRRRTGAWRLGARWGIGHALGVGVVGGLTVACRGVLPAGLVESVSGWSERVVGMVLVGIGVWGLRNVIGTRVHAHAHAHGGARHVHVHVHEPANEHASPSAHVHTHAAFAVGVLHGIAGSAHLLGVLPALALPAIRACWWLLGFGLGTVAGMVVFAAGIGTLAGQGRLEYGWHRAVAGGCAVSALVVGGVWLFP